MAGHPDNPVAPRRRRAAPRRGVSRATFRSTKIVLQFLPPAEPKRPEPVAGPPVSDRQTVPGSDRAGRPRLASRPETALRLATRSARPRPRRRIRPPAARTSPGIDSGYWKRFAAPPGAGLPLAGWPTSLRRDRRQHVPRAGPGPSNAAPPATRRRRALARRARTRSARARRVPRTSPAAATSRRSATGAGLERRHVELPVSALAPSQLATTARARCSPRLQPVPLLARELGFVGEHVDDRRVEPLLEQRQQLGAHAVARDRSHRRSISSWTNVDARSPRYAAQVGAPAVEERPDQTCRAADASTARPREPAPRRSRSRNVSA